EVPSSREPASIAMGSPSKAGRASFTSARPPQAKIDIARRLVTLGFALMTNHRGAGSKAASTEETSPLLPRIHDLVARGSRSPRLLRAVVQPPVHHHRCTVSPSPRRAREREPRTD